MNIKKDIIAAVDQRVGWDEIVIEAIEKFGKELSIKTDQGEIFISARKFFEQHEFRARVFEEFGIYLDKVKSDRYGKWVKQWSETLMKDLKVDDSDLIDTVESYIEGYLEETTETDVKYLQMGRPVLLDDSEVAFRSNDVINRLKTEGYTISNDQVYFIFRRMGCGTKRISSERMRVWVWRK